MNQLHGIITSVKTIADRLRHAREQAGLTQPELARLAGVTPGTIGNIEAGIRKQPRGILEIASALRVSPEWLLHGKGEPGADIAYANMARENSPVYMPRPKPDPLTSEFLELLSQLDKQGKREAVIWLRGFVEGRRPHHIGRAPHVAG